MTSRGPTLIICVNANMLCYPTDLGLAPVLSTIARSPDQSTKVASNRYTTSKLKQEDAIATGSCVGTNA